MSSRAASPRLSLTAYARRVSSTSWLSLRCVATGCYFTIVKVSCLAFDSPAVLAALMVSV
jgi:hypothetical protein